MQAGELERLQNHYARMSGDALHTALYYGPDAYRSSEVWKIIVEAVGRRSMAVPTQADLREHEAAERAAELAEQPPAVPLGWGLYIALTRLILALIVLFFVQTIVAMLYAPDHHEGWELDLRDHLVGFGVVCLVAWAGHRHMIAIRERFRGGPGRGAA
jgi:hypothetical protein